VSVDGAFAVFDQQDSGCLSYGIERAGRRWFVKTARSPAAAAALTRVVALHRAVRHPAIVRPVAVRPGPTLVYPWCLGEVLNAATLHGSGRAGLDRFRRQPRNRRRAAVDTILDAHLAITAAGWIAVDLYDGCFLYDADTDRMRLIDLDEYRPGPFVLDADRLPGSSRYMAPEEWTRGATIDERTTVFALGRTVQQLLGGDPVADRATDPDPDRRHSTVAALVAAWRGLS
jgi:serine/threonine-protein kinase